MSVKRIFGKIFGKKEDSPQDESPPEEVQHEISYGGSTTVIEQTIKMPIQPDPMEEGPEAKTVPEIEIFIHNEKTNVVPVTGELRIGRDPSQTDIAIPELIVSKFHCTIYFKENQVYIKDNNSTNGTFVNGQLTPEETPLEDNALISLGKKGTVRLIYHERGAR